jgi:hypothetical protein
VAELCLVRPLRVLDIQRCVIQSVVMEFPALSSALAEHFGTDAEIESPEDESDAWRSIVQECRRGGYPHLLQDLDRLLSRADAEVVQFLEAHAPAWKFDAASDARHGLEVFQSYVETYSE